MTTPTTFRQWIIVLVILLGVLAILYAAVQYFGLPIPQIVWTIAGIVLVVALVIVAIRFLFGLGGVE